MVAINPLALAQQLRFDIYIVMSSLVLILSLPYYLYSRRYKSLVFQYFTHKIKLTYNVCG